MRRKPIVNDMAKSEREKAAQTLPEMLAWLAEHPERHTPFFDRWFRLIVEHQTMIYPIKRLGCKVGLRLQHGKPVRVVECVESALPFGKPLVWFVKVCS